MLLPGQRVLLAKCSQVITPEHETLLVLTSFPYLQNPSWKNALESQAGLNKYLNKQSTGVPASGQQFSCQNCRALSSCTARAVQQGPGIKSVHTSVMVEEREQHTCLIWLWTGSQPACPETAAHVSWEQLIQQGELEPGGHRMGGHPTSPFCLKGLWSLLLCP